MIAAVNGAAVGGGNEIVVACDLAIAAESATFGQTGPRVGSAPVLGGTNHARRSTIGEKRAKEVSMLCRRYTAPRGLRAGLDQRGRPATRRSRTTVTAWADEILQLSPRYLEIAKISSNVWWNKMRESLPVRAWGCSRQAIGSEDMIEGATAFMEKRQPHFRGQPEA